ncbi:transposase [Bdellovibrio sp. HCB337]|uniref:transposase n=1 Tax=Bdellovibrio sp. HCB337 TaxID=3394358 RepID=UPI0039A6FF60
MAEIRFSTSPVKALNSTARVGVPRQVFLVLAVYLLAALLFGKAFAAPAKGKAKGTKVASASSVAIEPLPQLKTDILTDNQKSKHRAYGHVRLEGMKYFTELPDNPKLNYSQFLSGQLSYVGENDWIENAADVSAGTFFSQNLSHFVVHELYTSPRTSSFRAYVGRKKNNWSEMDHDWNLGVWQPFYELDSLRPEEQGLTGAFLDVNRENWQILGFVTPMFIPSMGPDVREEGGGLVADSRWYHAPSRTVDFASSPMIITYKLSIPETAKLASHGGYAMMARAGNKESGAWAVASYGHTPVNQLLLKRNIKVAMTNDVGVIVSPDVTYHNVASADLGYTHGNVRGTLSYMRDDPEEKLPDPDWAIQKLSGIRAYSASLDVTIPSFLSRSIMMQLNYLRVEGGKIQDIVSDGTADDINLYDQRLKFTNAVKVKVQGELVRIYRRPLVTKFSYLYDQEQKGSMVNTEFLFYPSQEWALVMGADFLGAEENTTKTSSFLNQYRANDRVYGGMTYVF